MIRAINLVNDYYHTEIRKKSRKREFNTARQIYLYSMNRSTTYSLQKLAESVNLKSHATVLHAIRTVKDISEVDKIYKAEVDQIADKIAMIYENDRLNNFLTEEQEEKVAAWVSEKLVPIDTDQKGWRFQTVKNLDVKKLIHLLNLYKIEIL